MFIHYMYTYVCIHIYITIYGYICTYIYIYVYINTYIYILHFTHTHARSHTYTHRHSHKHVRTHTNAHTHTYTCTHTHTRTHTHMHKYMYTYSLCIYARIHTHMYQTDSKILNSYGHGLRPLFVITITHALSRKSSRSGNNHNEFIQHQRHTQGQRKTHIPGLRAGREKAAADSHNAITSTSRRMGAISVFFRLQYSLERLLIWRESRRQCGKVVERTVLKYCIVPVSTAFVCLYTQVRALMVSCCRCLQWMDMTMVRSVVHVIEG